MSDVENYDAIVIGAGQAGSPLSQALARAGWKTALVERQHVGGTCLNEGCTPTKTMIASARVASVARRAAGYGVQVGPVSVDLGVVRQRKREMVASFVGGSERRIDLAGVDLLRGEAHFNGQSASGVYQVEVQFENGELRHLQSGKVFINSGTHPVRPALPGLEGVPLLDSTSIMELDQVPEHLLVLGGGYIGVEFGQMFRRFGSRVTIVQHGPQLLGREDEDITSEVLRIFEEDGITVLLNSTALSAHQREDGDLELEVQTLQGVRSLVGSHLLAAVGRAPNTQSLNLESAGVKLDSRGFIQVDEHLQTNLPGIYAMGDVNGGPAFTHIAYDDFRILRTNLLEGGQASTQGRMVPYTVFIDPQLGRIGLTEEQARRKGLKIRVAKIPMKFVSRALEVDESRGLMKAVVDATSGQILGFAALGMEGGELMAMVEITMLGRLPYTVLKEAVFAHPTLAESLNTLFMQMDPG